MRGAVNHGVRLLVLAGMIGLGLGQAQAQATLRHAATTAGVRQAAAKGETAEELVYQGKILPIVTDVYNSINALGTAINDRSVSEVSQAAEQFGVEQQQFEAVKPVPGPLRSAAATLDQGLRNLANGTKALVAGLQASDNSSVQQAATVLQRGLQLFQSAVSQVRKLAGPATPSSSSSSSHTNGPVPTPIIKGLP